MASPSKYTDLNPSPRLLLGPGPSMVHPRVLRAMATPLIGHLDPEFITIMNEIQDLLRMVFQASDDTLTIPVSGTGSAAMEAAVANFVEEGDPVLICVNGYFGERLIDMATRYGADVQRIDAEWGTVFSAQQVDEALQQHPAKVVMIVQAETSTGALQPLAEITEVVHRHGALMLVDAVTSLGGVPVDMAANDIDIAYSGTQKCLSAPPGLGPLAVAPRALEAFKKRESIVPNWYLDLSMVLKYWGPERTYHHTAPISMNYALREALRLVDEEGLEQRFVRHQENAQYLWDGLAALDLTPHVVPEYRLPSLTTVRLAEGMDDAGTRRRLLE